MNLLIPWFPMALFVGLSGFLPFATYAVSLALFGLPHVIYELRYLDARFRPRLDKSLVEASIALSLIFMLIYALAFSSVEQTAPAKNIVLLGLLAIPLFRYRNLLSFPFVLIPAIGILYVPEITFLILAFLHNLTPWIFLRKQDENWTFSKDLKAAFIFIGLPIFAGLTAYFLNSEMVLENGLWSLGQVHLFALHYLPKSASLDTLDQAYFSTAVMAQLIHYYMVLRIFPKRHGDQVPTLVPWPTKKKLFIVTSLITGIAASLYYVDFGKARSLYSIAAALHSSLEWPLIVLFLSTNIKLNRTKSPRDQLETAAS